MTEPATLPTHGDAAMDIMPRRCLAYRFRRAARAITHHYDDALDGVGVTSTQLTVLSAVRLGPGLSVSELAETVGLERSSLSRNLSLLERKGLVRTVPGEDRRTRSAILTDEGQDTLRRGFERWQGIQSELEEVFGEDRFDELLEMARQTTRTI